MHWFHQPQQHQRRGRPRVGESVVETRAPEDQRAPRSDLTVQPKPPQPAGVSPSASPSAWATAR